MSKTIYIEGAGGPAGIGLARCLKDHYDLLGVDASPRARDMMECPPTKGGEYFIMPIPVPDVLVKRELGNPLAFLPPKEQVELCQDKAKTAEILGDLAPRTYWLRDTHGAGGSGAQMLTNFLPGRNYSVEYVIYRGEILASFQKERISYNIKGKTEGIQNIGSSVVSICTNEDGVWQNAIAALWRISEQTNSDLHGFYGVDLKCDERGIPKVTEINAGRLLTASYSYYWLTGYNLPLVGVRAQLGEKQEPLPAYPEGYGIIRQIDQLPKLFTPEQTESWR